MIRQLKKTTGLNGNIRQKHLQKIIGHIKASVTTKKQKNKNKILNEWN